MKSQAVKLACDVQPGGCRPPCSSSIDLTRGSYPSINFIVSSLAACIYKEASLSATPLRHSSSYILLTIQYQERSCKEETYDDHDVDDDDGLV